MLKKPSSNSYPSAYVHFEDKNLSFELYWKYLGFPEDINGAMNPTDVPFTKEEQHIGYENGEPLSPFIENRIGRCAWQRCRAADLAVHLGNRQLGS